MLFYYFCQIFSFLCKHRLPHDSDTARKNIKFSLRFISTHCLSVIRKTLDLFTLVIPFLNTLSSSFAYSLLPPSLDFDLKKVYATKIQRQPQKKEGWRSGKARFIIVHSVFRILFTGNVKPESRTTMH